MQDPTPGRIVFYRPTEEEAAPLPAMVVSTQETAGRAEPPVSSPDHVHLLVFSMGDPPVTQVFDVPLWEPSGPSMQELAKPDGPRTPPEEQPGGTWIWPVIHR